MESIDVRLARIEEGQKALAERITRYHESLSDKVEKIKSRSETVTLDLALIKRDRWWMTTIGSVFGATTALVVEWFRR